MVSAHFTEDELEQTAIGWLQELGYDYRFGPDIAPDGASPERGHYGDVILENRLRSTLATLNPDLPVTAIEEAIQKLKRVEHPDLLANNRDFHNYVRGGIPVTVKASHGDRTLYASLFDREQLDHNDWLAVNQFTVIDHGHTRRLDLVLFVNGIPVVAFELKNAADPSATIEKAYKQFQTYKAEIPSFLQYNGFLVISDGFNARAGTLTADEERFMQWRTVDGETLAPVSVSQLEVLIRGMCERVRLLDILFSFLLFQDDGTALIKILAAYHQAHAVNKAVEQTKRAIDGDRRIGVIWHTQGSGKSLTMVFYAGKIVLELNNPTLVVITDRNDLDDQLFNTFCISSELLRQTPKQATSRSHLRELLSVQSGGVIFTTIQKFAPAEGDDRIPVLCDRRNVIVIADEAHRSQYGFQADIVSNKPANAMTYPMAADPGLITSPVPHVESLSPYGPVGNVQVKYGHAKYLRDALPNAAFIGFTGTPVELADRNTPAVFGDYIDTYDMSRAVADEATVRIYYESRIAKIELPESERPHLDSDFEEITENQEDAARTKLKSKWASLEAVVGAEKRVKLVASDIVEHFEKRQAAAFGKSMIVVMSRRIAVALYDAIVALRPDWHDPTVDKGKIKIVMTGSASDPTDWQQHIGGDKRRKTLATRMKNPDDPMQIVIVRDMWLTGFDVPCLNTMYVDKPMQGHSLMQAIARVNRVFKDKPGGLIVDYIGLADNLKQALAQYSPGDRQTAGLDTGLALATLQEKVEVLRGILHGYDYQPFFIPATPNRMSILLGALNHVLGQSETDRNDFLQTVDEAARLFSLCAANAAAEAFNLEVGFFKAIKAGIVKMAPPPPRPKNGLTVDAAVAQLVSKSIVSDSVVDVMKELGVDRADISILSDEFLEEVRRIEHKNIAVELLKRLINGKIKAMTQRTVRSREFSTMLLSAIQRYQAHTIDTAQVILELIELAKAMNKAQAEGQALGLSTAELAFYEALGVNDSAVKVLGDEILKKIARELTESIRRNATVDWNKRSAVQAKMRVMIRRLLRKYNYPPDKQESAVETIIEQAEKLCGNE